MQYQTHRAGQIVITDMMGRDTTDHVERFDMPFQERFLPRGRIHTMNCPLGIGEPEHKHLTAGFLPAQHHPHLTEIDLGFLTG